MKVHQFTKLLYGGAGVAVRRLHEGLLQLGVDSHLWFESGPDAGDRSRSQDQWYTGWRRHRLRFTRRWGSLRHRLGLNPAARGFFTSPELACPTPLPFAPAPGTLLQLHWITQMLDYRSFFRSVPADLPVVWTAHDLNALTGGCHYTGSCRRFENACGECPVLVRSGPADASARHHRTKRDSLRHLRQLHVVGDSRWVESMARRSPILAHARSFRTIHYGLDAEVFAPGDRPQARHRLGLSPDKFVVAFGAFNLAEPRKGSQVLARALASSTALRDAELVIFGHDTSPFGALPQRVVSVGPADDPARLVDVYRSADVFAMPSLEEAFGQTALESLACGVPVVGSEVGGIPDMLGGTGCGILVPPGDPEALRAALKALAADPGQRRAMGDAGRALVLRQFTLAHQAQNYARLYEELLAVPR